MLPRRLRVIWKPEMYQGREKMRNYFEGWYFKMVNKTKDDSLAIIPGVSFGDGPEDSHSFIQVMRGPSAHATYHNFSLDDFESSDQEFKIWIGKNSFSLEGITLDIADEKGTAVGDVRFGESIPWPVSRLSPGAMGPFRFIPRMECLHGILSFDHPLKGSVEADGETIDFSGGRGYIEKDWGAGFPSAWIWMQSNHFDIPGVSFTSSIATIPWLRRSFAGFLIGFLFDGRVYRFTTYTRAKASDIEVSESEVRFKVSDRGNGLAVNAYRSGGATLRSPESGLMDGRIVESLTARIHLRFFEIVDGHERVLFEGTGTNAGLEVVGDMSELGATELS
ncbi:hypothetical protein EU520_00735 [Candidatus Thorarchaeota archaeon]|nr:MAG: hypothetical protein EU520_00735 [Candidatus Thorarchaeota archaeon]